MDGHNNNIYKNAQKSANNSLFGCIQNPPKEQRYKIHLHDCHCNEEHFLPI